MRDYGTPESRLLKRVEKTPTCWLWVGCRLPTGYGQMTVSQRKVYVHRLMYEIGHGPIPAGMEIDHTCRTRNCVRLDHLELVTHAENVRRSAPYMGTRGRNTVACPKGHPYDEVNTYHHKGRRYCRICKRERWIAAYYTKPAGERYSGHRKTL